MELLTTLRWEKEGWNEEDKEKECLEREGSWYSFSEKGDKGRSE